jgi:excisionase family DNA binding protein
MNATKLLADVREARQSLIEATYVTSELDMAALFAARFSELDTLLGQGTAPPADWAAGLPAEELLTTAEVATLFRVDPQTVRRWALADKLTDIKTPGGRRRFRAAEVRVLYARAQQEPTAA